MVSQRTWTHCRGGLGGGCLVYVGYYYACAVCGEFLRYGPADALTGAGDDRDLVVQFSQADSFRSVTM
jgi:hypothetical protein